MSPHVLGNVNIGLIIETFRWAKDALISVLHKFVVYSSLHSSFALVRSPQSVRFFLVEFDFLCLLQMEDLGFSSFCECTLFPCTKGIARFFFVTPCLAFFLRLGPRSPLSQS